MPLNDTFTPKNANNRNCHKCDFVCSKPSDWNRHISTPKHKKNTQMMPNDDKNYANQVINLLKQIYLRTVSGKRNLEI